ncbi:MAG: metal ABC transporter permease [Clostridia bacterium]|nr:metal ABC transporter permease [Clostridia bacterium]
MNIIETVSNYLSYDFVKYALIAGVLVSLCSALLGVNLVLKRYSMIGDGLSHVAFGATAIAAVLNAAPMYFALPVTVIAAILLLRMGKNTKIQGDAATAMISVGALALGYMLMNIFSTNANVSGDVCTTLFGSTSILTLSKTDVYMCLALAAVVIVCYVVFYNRLFSVTFDESFATATGTNAAVYNLALAIITAVVIVLAMNIVGALLVSALIIFPALSAMRIFKSFKSVVISSAIIAVVCSLSGIFASMIFDTPVGATIVAADAIVFGVFCIAGKIKK